MDLSNPEKAFLSEDGVFPREREVDLRSYPPLVFLRILSSLVRGKWI